MSTDFNNKENSKVLKETKEEKLIEKNSINFTPKLGLKYQKKIYENKNLNTSGEFNNSIYPQSESRSSLEDMFISIKNLENKMNFIEKILQSSNCLISQEYSIQNDENTKKKEKENINNNGEDKFNEEKILNLMNELINSLSLSLEDTYNKIWKLIFGDSFPRRNKRLKVKKFHKFLWIFI